MSYCCQCRVVEQEIGWIATFSLVPGKPLVMCRRRFRHGHVVSQSDRYRCSSTANLPKVGISGRLANKRQGDDECYGRKG